VCAVSGVAVCMAECAVLGVTGFIAVCTIPRATGEPDEVGIEDRRLSGDKGLGGTCAVDVG
jgi:hypothetical protein